MPDEHIEINDLKHVLFGDNEHRELEGYSQRSRNDHAGSSSTHQKREHTSYPRRCRSALATCHEWQAQKGETDKNSADLQGFVQSELGALSAGIDVSSIDILKIFTHEAMELSFVPAALVTIRAARDKMKGKSEGKGEPVVSFSGKGNGKWRKQNSAKLFPQCPGMRNTNFITWPDDRMLPNHDRTIMIVEQN